MTKTFPYGKRSAQRAKGNAVLDAGSLQADRAAGRWRRGRERAPALGEQLPDRRRAALGHRPPAVRRRPADRLLLPRPDARGRHQLARRAGARRDRAGLPGQHPDRPRAGLRVEPDVGRLGPDRQRTSRRCAAARRRSTATRASAARWARSTRARSRAPGRVQLPHDRPRPGHRLREGRRQDASRSRASARASARTSSGSSPFRDADDRARSSSAQTFRKAMPRSPFTFNVGYADDRDIAMYSAGKLPKRDPRRRPAPAHQGHRRVRVEGLPVRGRSTRSQVNPPSGHAGQLEQPARRRGWGAADDNWSYGSLHRVRAAQRPASPSAEARPRVGDVGDERAPRRRTCAASR